MGTTSSSTATPTVTEGGSYRPAHPPRSSNQGTPDMALAFETQASTHDDLGHDTLMGLQELDSHLTLFEDLVDTSTDASMLDTPSIPRNAPEDASNSNGQGHVNEVRISGKIPISKPDVTHAVNKPYANGSLKYVLAMFKQLPLFALLCFD